MKCFFQFIVPVFLMSILMACSASTDPTRVAPESTGLPPVSPTETEKPSDPTPMPKMEPTATPIPEPTETEIPIAELVPIYILCNCQQEVPGNAPVRLHFGWSTKLPEQALAFRDVAHIKLSLDGEDLGNLDSFWRDELRGPEERDFPYTVGWAYQIEPFSLEVGIHRIEAVVSIDESGTDGVDTFGPGEVASGSVEIIVIEF